jgi:tetratricopeptide (TPR) repeat protein
VLSLVVVACASTTPAPVRDAGPRVQPTDINAILALGPRAALQVSWGELGSWARRKVREHLATRFPDTAEGLFSRGWLTQGDAQLDLYRQAVARDPGLAEGWASLARGLWSTGRRKEAREALEAALEAVKARNARDIGVLLMVEPTARRFRKAAAKGRFGTIRWCAGSRAVSVSRH